MRNRVYAVIDTNVLVSALIAKDNDSYPLKVLGYAYSGKIVPLFNDEILEEYQEVLKRGKFNLSAEDISQAISTLARLGESVTRISIHEEYFPDESDRKFYEVMMSRENAFLITGNGKHYPHRQNVVTPREMVEILNGLYKVVTLDEIDEEIRLSREGK